MYKRATTFAVITLLALAVSQGATAQMGGGGTGSGGQGSCDGNGNGNGNGTGGAGGPGMGGGMGPGGAMNGGGLVVAPDGTSYLVTRTPATATETGASTLVAVGANGQKAWEWTTEGGIREPLLVGTLVVAVVGDADGDQTPEAAVVALQAASGTEAWRVALDAHVARLEAATDRLVALVVEPATASSDGSAPADPDRSLVAIDLAGHVLWTFDVDD
ncbi:MAG: hypothetical protein EDX89_17295 [Acidobacteria bacterium]|nr:MAG: hypothetical protein EDX89_17295 [Acidobacteriota bacterium]